MKLTWFGHAAFMLELDKVVFSCLIDPWLDNPSLTTARPQLPDKLDAIFLTHGHADHVGNTVELAKRYPEVLIYCIYELTFYLRAHGVSETRLVGMNKGGSVHLADGNLVATMVHAEHSSSTCGDSNAPSSLSCGGSAAGWILECRRSHGDSAITMYHSGDTDVFGDMRLINDLYRPNVALLCIGDRFTMGPRGASYALDHLLTHVRVAIPMHFGTFPLLTGRPEHMSAVRDQLHIYTMSPGTSLNLCDHV